MAKILIVEDDTDLIETYTDLFEANGHSVQYASRVSEANRYIAEMQPDIITLDLNLVGNSSAVIADFIHLAKSLIQCKIIVISGHAEMMSGQQWVDDVDLALTKPVDNHQLLMMVDRLLSL